MVSGFRIHGSLFSEMAVSKTPDTGATEPGILNQLNQYHVTINKAIAQYFISQYLLIGHLAFSPVRQCTNLLPFKFNYNDIINNFYASLGRINRHTLVFLRSQNYIFFFLCSRVKASAKIIIPHSHIMPVPF